MKHKFIITALSALILNVSTIAAMPSDFKIMDPNLGHKIFTDALNAKDTELLIALYADDAIMIAPGNKVIKGKKDIRTFFEEAVPVIENIKLDTVFRINYTDTVVFRSNYTVTYKLPDGKIITESTSGVEVEQKQADGTWLFIVDHHYGGADLEQFKLLNMPK